MNKIELRRVSKRYGYESVFESFDLAIRDGSITMLLGPSGSGKSTLLHLIAGLAKEDSGEILIDGCNMFDRERNERDLAVVFQHNVMYPSLTFRETLESDLRKTSVPKKEWNQMILDVAAVMGLEHQLPLKPRFLSGGQRQRAILARAIMKKPGILLLDEPLEGLDATSRRHVMAYFRELNRLHGTTFVYVTHDQEEALSLGSDIILLENGRIRQQGSPTAIRTDPSNLFSAGFIGSPPMNVLSLASLDPHRHLHVAVPGSARHVGFRPEKVRLSDKPFTNAFSGLHLTGIAESSEPVANGLLLQVRLESEKIQVLAPDEGGVAAGRVWLQISPENLFWFSGDGSRTARSPLLLYPVAVQDWMMAEVN